MKYPPPITGEIMPGLLWRFNLSQRYHERNELKIPQAFKNITTPAPPLAEFKLLTTTSSEVFPTDTLETNESVTIAEEVTATTIEETTEETTTQEMSIKTSRIMCSKKYPHGEWSEWKTDVECTADCGSCGLLQRKRQCLSFKNGTGCPCVGEYKMTEPCNIEACSYPKPACCPPYNLIYLDGYFACGPQEKEITDMFLEDMKQQEI